MVEMVGVGFVSCSLGLWDNNSVIMRIEIGPHSWLCTFVLSMAMLTCRVIDWWRQVSMTLTFTALYSRLTGKQSFILFNRWKSNPRSYIQTLIVPRDKEIASEPLASYRWFVRSHWLLPSLKNGVAKGAFRNMHAGFINKNWPSRINLRDVSW